MKHVINGIEHILAYLPHKKRHEGVILTTDLQCLLIQFDDNHGFYVSHEHDHLSFNTEYLLEPSEFVQLNAYLARYYPSHITLDTLAKTLPMLNPEGQYSFTYTHEKEYIRCSLLFLEYDAEEIFTLHKDKIHNTMQWCVHPSSNPETLPCVASLLFATMLHLAEQQKLASGASYTGTIDDILHGLMQPSASMTFS